MSLLEAFLAITAGWDSGFPQQLFCSGRNGQRDGDKLIH